MLLNVKIYTSVPQGRTPHHINHERRKKLMISPFRSGQFLSDVSDGAGEEHQGITLASRFRHCHLI